MAHRGLQHQSWAHWYPQHCPGHLSRGISSSRRKQLNCKPVVDVCRLINSYSVQAQVIRKTQCTCLQATPDLVSCSSSALVSHGRNLTASLVMVWWVHVTPSKCWQAGHLNAGWAKSFGTCLMVIKFSAGLRSDQDITFILTALLQQFLSGLQLQAEPAALAVSKFQQIFQCQRSNFCITAAST